MHESDAQGEVCYLLLHCLLYAKMTFFATDFFAFADIKKL